MPAPDGRWARPWQPARPFRRASQPTSPACRPACAARSRGVRAGGSVRMMPAVAADKGGGEPASPPPRPHARRVARCALASAPPCAAGMAGKRERGKRGGLPAGDKSAPCYGAFRRPSPQCRRTRQPVIGPAACLRAGSAAAPHRGAGMAAAADPECMLLPECRACGRGHILRRLGGGE